MVGNNISGSVFERTILCLNARRETRLIAALTNQSITVLTNISLSTLTNQIITVVTNQSRTLATNQVAAPASVQARLTPTNEPDPTETNHIVLNSSLPSSSTNQTFTTVNNSTVSRAPSQIVTTANSQTLLSLQVTTTMNNLSITTADNRISSFETNQVITTLTNQMVTAVTNQIVIRTNMLLQDYYLYAELTPPPDFVLQSGESLVLLVDGVRRGFIQTNSPTAFVPRRGFSSSLYRISPEALAEVANAKQVKVRLKGVNGVIEKEMSQTSRNNFTKFIRKYSSQPVSLDGDASARN